ncbi:hypothetical protein VTI28DRAFT_6864 [Corynascus sepedonium]
MVHNSQNRRTTAFLSTKVPCYHEISSNRHSQKSYTTGNYTVFGLRRTVLRPQSRSSTRRKRKRNRKCNEARVSPILLPHKETQRSFPSILPPFCYQWTK